VPFRDAKDNVSNFMSDVVRKHTIRLLSRGRADPEELLAIEVDDLLRGLSECRLEARTSRGDQGIIARLPQFGLVVEGKDFDSAIDALRDELLDYCEEFFSDFEFYRKTDRVAHLPFLLRFALTPDDQRRALLVEPPRDAQARPHGEGALARAR